MFFFPLFSRIFCHSWNEVVDCDETHQTAPLREKRLWQFRDEVESVPHIFRPKATVRKCSLSNGPRIATAVKEVSSRTFTFPTRHSSTPLVDTNSGSLTENCVESNRVLAIVDVLLL